MASVFTPILNGESVRPLIYKDSICGAFLTNQPNSPGHTLVVPLEETDHWLDISQDVMLHMYTVVSTIARAQMAVYNPKRIGVILSGFAVPHCHIHVIPADDTWDLELATYTPTASDETLAEFSKDMIDMVRTVQFG